MITLQTILDRLDLKILTKTREFSAIPINSGYASDILSCVMSGARANCIWVTLIANINIVAVASLLGIPAVILTEGAQPDERNHRPRESGRNRAALDPLRAVINHRRALANGHQKTTKPRAASAE